MNYFKEITKKYKGKYAERFGPVEMLLFVKENRITQIFYDGEDLKTFIFDEKTDNNILEQIYILFESRVIRTEEEKFVDYYLTGEKMFINDIEYLFIRR